MGRNVTIVVFLMLLVIADASSTTFLYKHRYLAAVESSNKTTTFSPSPSPVSTTDANKETNSKDPQVPSNIDGSKVDQKGTSSTESVKDPPQLPSNTDGSKVDQKVTSSTESAKDPTQVHSNTDGSKVDQKGTSSTESMKDPKKDADGDKNQETKKKEVHQVTTPPVTAENCTGLTKSCKDDKSLIACIPNYRAGSKEIVVLVQNDGDVTLEVNLTIPGSLESPPKLLKILKHQNKNVNVTVNKSTRLVLNAGKGECVLKIGVEESEQNFFVLLPSYKKLVTPINAAYFIVITVIIFGGTWACYYTIRRKRHQGEIPYQELEMGGLPESHMVNNVETAEGWDQGWDDDWDDETAVKSPVGRLVGSISANGLTSRAANKDGWQNDWDD